MMVEEVKITKFKAADGSLHDTRDAAVSHNAWIADQKREGWVKDLLAADFNEILRSLRDNWVNIDDWQQEDTIRQLVQAVIRNFPPISEILSEKGPK